MLGRAGLQDSSTFAFLHCGLLLLRAALGSQASYRVFCRATSEPLPASHDRLYNLDTFRLVRPAAQGARGVDTDAQIDAVCLDGMLKRPPLVLISGYSYPLCPPEPACSSGLHAAPLNNGACLQHPCPASLAVPQVPPTAAAAPCPRQRRRKPRRPSRRR